MSNHWYDKAVYYQMYPPGIIGAPKENPTQITDIPPDQDPSKGFLELDLRVSHSKESGCSALYIGPLFESSFHGYDTRDYKLMDKRLGTNQGESFSPSRIFRRKRTILPTGSMPLPAMGKFLDHYRCQQR